MSSPGNGLPIFSLMRPAALMEDHRMPSQLRRLFVTRSILYAVGLIVLCLISLGAGVFVFIRVGLDGPRVATVLISEAQRRTGRQFSFSAAELSWPSATRARLTVSGLECRESRNGPVSLTMARVVLDVNTLQIAAGSVALDVAHISGLVVHLPSATEDSGPPRSKMDFPAGSYRSPLFPEIGSLLIEQAKVVVAGPPRSNGSARVLISDLRIAGSNVSPLGAEEIEIRGVMPGDEGNGVLEAVGNVESFPLSGGQWQGSLRATAQGCPLSGISQISAALGLEIPLCQGTVDSQVQVKGKTKKLNASGKLQIRNAVVLPGRRLLKQAFIQSAGLEFAADLVDDNLYLEVKRLFLPGAAVSADAKVDRAFSPDASLTVDVHKAVLDLAALSPFIPIKLMKEEDRSRLMKAGLEGTIVVTAASWTGKLSRALSEDAWNGLLVVNAVLENVSGFVPQLGLPVKAASGRVRLTADDMLFNQVGMTLGTSPIMVNGSVLNLKSDPIIDLFVSVKAQAQEIYPVLRARSISRNLPRWFQWIKEPAGGVEISLDLKGSLKRPKASGHILFRGFRFALPQVPLVFTDIKGALEFSGTGLSFSEVTCLAGSSPMKITGDLSPEKMLVGIEAEAAQDDLKQLGILPDPCVLSRKAPVVVTLEGSPSHPRFSVVVDLKGNHLRVGHYLDKKAGIPLAITVAGSKDGDAFKLDLSHIALAKSKIAIQGVIGVEGRVDLALSLPPKGITTDELVSYAAAWIRLQSGGRIEGDAAFAFGPDHSMPSNLRVDVALNHVTMNLFGFHKPMEGLTGKIHWVNDTFQANVERAKLGSSKFTSSFTIKGWQRPKVDVNLDFSFLDTTDFSAPPGHVSDKTWGEWIASNSAIRFLARSEGTARVIAAKGTTARYPFSDFRANIDGKNGLLKAPQCSLNLAGGVLRGDASFDIRADTKKPLAIDLQADALRVERLLLPDAGFMSIEGAAVLQGKLEFHTTPKRENAGLYMTGLMEVRLSNGVIHEFEILSKIFSLVNLGSLVRGRLPDITAGGLPFHQWTWKMQGFDDKWKVKEMKLLSDAARMDAHGMYFRKQGRIDFLVEVSPLVGLDQIVSGLFRGLIPKDTKTFTTMFKVRGLYSSPDVRLAGPEPFDAR